MSTIQVRRRLGKVRQPKTDVLATELRRQPVVIPSFQGNVSERTSLQLLQCRRTFAYSQHVTFSTFSLISIFLTTACFLNARYILFFADSVVKSQSVDKFSMQKVVIFLRISSDSLVSLPLPLALVFFQGIAFFRIKRV